MEIKLKKGKILVYRVFDIGSEIDLEKVEALFEEKKFKERFKLDRKHNMSLIISKSPVSVHLGTIDFKVLDSVQTCELVAKVWHFGTLSLCFQVPIVEGTTWPQLIKIASWIENETDIDQIAILKAKDFQKEISSAIPVTNNDWSLYEDYVTYFIQEFDGLNVPLSELNQQVDVAALILAETKENLSDAIKKNTLDNTYQYSKQDLVVVDWNSALVVEASGSMDVPLVIEFALNQLLEMRYYDDLLDEKLNNLYNNVVGGKKGIFSKQYAKFAEEAGQIYIEISEIVENVENSFKVVGDFYLAQIFRASSKRFRFDDWVRSINEKLGNLAEVSKLLHSEVNESRNQIMEITIIALIAVEVVPLIWKLVF
jgi:hypothetical protein